MNHHFGIPFHCLHVIIIEKEKKNYGGQYSNGSGVILLALKNTMDSFGQQLQVKLQQHLSVADQQLKEYIIKTVHKKVGLIILNASG